MPKYIYPSNIINQKLDQTSNHHSNVVIITNISVTTPNSISYAKSEASYLQATSNIKEELDTPYSNSLPSGESTTKNNSTLFDLANNVSSEQSSERMQVAEISCGTCAGCGQQIKDRFFLQAVDCNWHADCLKCSVCLALFNGEASCFSKKGFIYCRDDYFRIYGQTACSRCGVVIKTSELVMKAKDQVFHLCCFACASCNRVLNTGEYFGMRDNMIYCQEDYEIVSCNPLPLPTGIFPGCLNASRLLPDIFPDAALVALSMYKCRGRKKGGCEEYQSNIDENFEGALSKYCLNSPTRQKRMRTSFKHHQLRAMKAYFTLNHNPDAKDLKQLSEKTGLSKRVLQVWFQNARAKYRRTSDKHCLDQTTDDSKMGSIVGLDGVTSRCNQQQKDNMLLDLDTGDDLLESGSLSVPNSSILDDDTMKSSDFDCDFEHLPADDSSLMSDVSSLNRGRSPMDHNYLTYCTLPNLSLLDVSFTQ